MRTETRLLYFTHQQLQVHRSIEMCVIPSLLYSPPTKTFLLHLTSESLQKQKQPSKKPEVTYLGKPPVE